MDLSRKLCVFLPLMGFAHAIMQTAQLDVQLSNGATYTLLASQASFGTYPKMGAEKNEPHKLKVPPQENPLLCTNVTQALPEMDSTYILVPRGECTFETKGMNAQRLGAAGIIVQGSLASRYTLNKTKEVEPTEEDIVYPILYSDYDCNKGRAEIPFSAIKMTPLPYNQEYNDPVLSGTAPSNLCIAKSPDFLAKCDSKACLLTGNKTKNGELEACCAWDLHIWLYSDPIFGNDDVQIPAVYVTMQQGERLLHDMRDNDVQITMSARVRAEYNLSAILIWGLGVFVAAMAAYLSASDYRSATREMMRRLASRSESADEDKNNVELQHDERVALTRSLSTGSSSYAPSAEETLELSAEHALGFIVMASSGLLILFFFKIYNVVKVLYGFGCSRAVMQVIFQPIFETIFQKARFVNKIIYRSGLEDIGDISVIDVLAGILSYALGFAWLYIAFTVRHPETNTFFWVTQDLLGACMCIMFLSLIKLNNMRVASILLLVAFFYDIFFVFVTPLIFKGESVMITVATSGGPPKADPLFCEKYPNDANCQGGDPLPMLFTVPRINDYQGGASLLGLGDIVLPGLLLSFAARLDAAKKFLGVMGGGNGTPNSYTCPEQKLCGSYCNTGYFPPLIVAYAIGLLMANAAVYLMNMGQPALLYLVPMCLGCMCFIGRKRNELAGLWEGPKVIKTVDIMLYGEYGEEGTGHVPLPTADADDEEGDLRVGDPA